MSKEKAALFWRLVVTALIVILGRGVSPLVSFVRLPSEKSAAGCQAKARAVRPSHRTEHFVLNNIPPASIVINYILTGLMLYLGIGSELSPAVPSPSPSGLCKQRIHAPSVSVSQFPML